MDYRGQSSYLIRFITMILCTAAHPSSDNRWVGVRTRRGMRASEKCIPSIQQRSTSGFSSQCLAGQAISVNGNQTSFFETSVFSNKGIQWSRCSRHQFVASQLTGTRRFGSKNAESKQLKAVFFFLSHANYQVTLILNSTALHHHCCLPFSWDLTCGHGLMERHWTTATICGAGLLVYVSLFLSAFEAGKRGLFAFQARCGAAWFIALCKPKATVAMANIRG